MRRRKRHSGYALLVTLVLLALLAVILGGMARRSADTALAARASEDAMRQRWAILSCQQTLLANAPNRFEARTQAWLEAVNDEEGIGAGWEDRPPSVETLALELEGVRLWLRIDDEQAKVNLNEALRRSPEAQLAPHVVIADTLAPAMVARPTLTRGEFIETLGLQPIESWSQVLPRQDPMPLLGIHTPEQLSRSQADREAPANRVTLWGDGRLNLYTATDETLQRALRDRVEPGTIEAFLRIRREAPGLGLRGMVDNATADQIEDRAALNAALTDRSRRYAMWLACRSTTPDTAATQWSLSVLEAASSDSAGISGGSGANSGGGASGVVRYYAW